jgi:hypothetical protein
MAGALMEVSEGRIPADRIALRELWKEISQWPALDEPISEEGVRARGGGGRGWEGEEWGMHDGGSTTQALLYIYNYILPCGQL